MRFGTIKRLLIFGGGTTCLEFARIGLTRGLDVQVVTSERHAAEASGGESFFQRLQQTGIDPLVAISMRDPAVRSLITGQTLGISFGAAWIFPPEFIDCFGGRLVNVHPAPLPRNRGAGGFSWRILRGDRHGALCLHLVEPGIDTGLVLRMGTFEYPTTCRTPSDFAWYTLQRNLPFLDQFLGDVVSGVEFPLSTQNESESTYFPRLNTERNGWIDWSWDVRNIERFICAFDEPYPGAATLFRGQPVRLRSCNVVQDGEDFHPFMSGLIYRTESDALYVAANGGGLKISIMEDFTGRSLVGEVAPGARLHTPRNTLDNALAFHAIYTPEGLKGEGLTK